MPNAGSSFATGLFQGMTGLGAGMVAKAEREKKLKFMQQYMEAIQKYQTDGTPISPEMAAQAAAYGMQPPAAALKGFDPSILEGGQAAGGMAPGAIGAVPTGAAPTGGGAGGPLDYADLLKGGFIDPKTAGLGTMGEQTLEAQAKNRDYWLKELHASQDETSNKPIYQYTDEEAQRRSEALFRLDKPRWRKFLDERTNFPTGGGGKAPILTPDEREDFFKKVDSGRSDLLDARQRAYGLELAPTPERRRYLYNNPFSRDEIMDFGDGGYQVALNEQWPFGGLGFPQDKEKWLKGEGAELSQEKRQFFGKFFVTNGEKDWDAIFVLGLERGMTVKKVVDRYNAEPSVENLIYRLLSAPPEAVANFQWEKIMTELPSVVDINDFKRMFREVYEAHHGVTPDIR